MSTLQKAIEIAAKAHEGQFDKSGKDYIGHPLRVMEMGRTEEEKIVGVLHDVVEDTPWTFEALEADAQLKQMWSEGTSVADIAAYFGRKQSAIITRLKKLGI